MRERESERARERESDFLLCYSGDRKWIRGVRYRNYEVILLPFIALTTSCQTVDNCIRRGVDRLFLLVSLLFSFSVWLNCFSISIRDKMKQYFFVSGTGWAKEPFFERHFVRTNMLFLNILAVRRAGRWSVGNAFLKSQKLIFLAIDHSKTPSKVTTKVF